MTLPDVIFDQHLAVVGKTGAGKTHAAKGFVERLLDLGRRVCIIDPTGAWSGLRSSADGKRPGYSVAIFGGEHGDMPIAETSGAAVAELIATRNLPAIIDLSELLIGQRHRFVTDFAEALHRLSRQVLHLVIDEADEVAPQNPLPETKRMLHQIDRIVRRGRIRGFRVMVITQRPAVLHKSILGQANTLIAMRLTLPHDRRAIEDWVKGQADLKQGADVLATLARLQRGEGWVWSPEHDLLERMTFPPIRTFDSSRAPEPGDELAAPATLAEVDLSGIRDALAEAERIAAENDPKLLRKRIAELEREAKGQRPAEADPAALDRAREDGFEDGFGAGYDRGVADTRECL